MGFIAHIKGIKSHSIVQQGLEILHNLTHRGAVGADPKAGDGAGILIQIPDRFFREELALQGIELPPPGEYGAGMVFLPHEPASRMACEYEIERAVKDEGQILLGWRDVPLDSSCLGESVKRIEPVIRQVFIGRGPATSDADAFERKLCILRRVAGLAIRSLNLAHTTSISPARPPPSKGSACSRWPRRRSACTARRSARIRCWRAPST